MAAKTKAGGRALARAGLQPRRIAIAPQPRTSRWPWFAAAAAGVVIAFWAYGPALRGPFLFDDTVLPFALPNFNAPLRVWIQGLRPVLYFTYWINAQLSKDDPYSYHVVNVLIHLVATGLVFLIVRRLLEWARIESPRRELLAGFAAALFLLHPAQTEAVAYLAGRSESLSVMFVFSAYAVFLYRRNTAIRWPTVAAILLLFGIALLSKEHTVVLPALLLLTDYWWNPGFSFRGIRDNWKLYVPVALGALGGVALFWKLILHAETAGFGMKDFTWYQYFFTQCRAIFVYIREFVFPVGLTADWDFPISKTIFDRRAILGLVILIALAAIAWIYRRRFPLATFGFFTYLLLMAPTSSILPIRDAIAERRLYLGMLGLLLITVDLLARVKIERRKLAAACAGLLLIEAAATHARAAVWSDPLLLWQDTALKSPAKPRVRFQLGFAWYDAHRYDLAIQEFEKTAQLEKPTYNLLIDWGLAYDAYGRPDEALAKLNQAAALEPTAHVYSQIAMINAKQAQWDQALAALATAEKLDPGFAMTYIYRGQIFLKLNRRADALGEYRRAIALDPSLIVQFGSQFR